MKYLLLLRGINVGGKNKVVMSELRAQIEALGYEAVTTYINSGNAFFETEESLERIKAKIGDMLATYPFTIYHVILSRDAYLADAAQVPDWWQEPLARRDVLFYTDQVDYEDMKARIQAMPLHDEVVHFGDRAVFWGKYTESEYLKSSYHKYLLKEDFYPQITIRNGKTFDKLRDLLG